MPSQNVAANFHLVRDREIDEPVAQGKIKLVRGGVYDFPFQLILRFKHVEFAGQSGRIRWLGELLRPRGGADQDAGARRRLTKRLRMSRPDGQRKACDPTEYTNI